MHTKSHL